MSRLWHIVLSLHVAPVCSYFAVIIKPYLRGWRKTSVLKKLSGDASAPSSSEIDERSGMHSCLWAKKQEGTIRFVGPVLRV